jgi:hypothetical protein
MTKVGASGGVWRFRDTQYGEVAGYSGKVIAVFASGGRVSSVSSLVSGLSFIVTCESCESICREVLNYAGVFAFRDRSAGN